MKREEPLLILINSTKAGIKQDKKFLLFFTLFFLFYLIFYIVGLMYFLSDISLKIGYAAVFLAFFYGFYLLIKSYLSEKKDLKYYSELLMSKKDEKENAR